MKTLIDSMDLSSTAKRKSYGSIEQGLKVNAYRKQVINSERSKGATQIEAINTANASVITKFGKAK